MVWPSGVTQRLCLQRMTSAIQHQIPPQPPFFQPLKRQSGPTSARSTTWGFIRSRLAPRPGRAARTRGSRLGGFVHAWMALNGGRGAVGPRAGGYLIFPDLVVAAQVAVVAAQMLDLLLQSNRSRRPDPRPAGAEPSRTGVWWDHRARSYPDCIPMHSSSQGIGAPQNAPITPDRACLCNRLVCLATRASGDGANLTSQAEGATVM